MTEPTDLRDVAALFRRFAWPHWRALLLLVCVSAAAAAATAIQPLMLAPAVDVTLSLRPPPAAGPAEVNLNTLGATLLAWIGITGPVSPVRLVSIVVMLFVVAVFAAAALNLLAYQLVVWVRATIAADIQAALLQHLLSLPLSFHHRQRVGELTTRILEDAPATARSFDPIVKGFFESTVQIAIFGYLLLRTDAVLAAAVAALALVHISFSRLLRRAVRRHAAGQLDAIADVGGQVTDAVLGVRVVQSFGAEAFEAARLHALLRRLRRGMVQAALYANSEGPLRAAAEAVAVGAAILISFAGLSWGRLTLSGFVLFIVVARQMTVPLSQLGAGLVQLQAMVGASRRIRGLLGSPLPTDGALDAPPLSRGITLEAVDFAHTPGTPALSSVSLEIPRGQVTAVVGPSGAGKSTLLDVILRLQEPSAGVVLYDGTDARLFRRGSYLRRFGVVPQEAFLFHASVQENVVCGRTLDRTELERVLGVANAADFVARLPDGMHTVIGDRGVRLSGGERQRIAIARALYGKPDVLVLDEATSALDAAGERLVRDAIEAAIAGTTALVVAHRLSTVVGADRIVVLSEGRVVDVGRHGDLLGQSPTYRGLVEDQFAAPTPPGERAH